MRYSILGIGRWKRWKRGEKEGREYMKDWNKRIESCRGRKDKERLGSRDITGGTGK